MAIFYGNGGDKRYAICDICGDRPHKHKDGTYRCGCLPDDGESPAEIRERAREARLLAAAGRLRGMVGKPKAAPLCEAEFARVAASRAGFYD